MEKQINYYLVREINTGLYFRGKGANRWGKYYNQASIYRMKAHAENAAQWLTLRGEPSEVVPIEILENTSRSVEVVKVETNIYDKEEIFPDCTVQVLTNTDDFCSYGERRTDG